MRPTRSRSPRRRFATSTSEESGTDPPMPGTEEMSGAERAGIDGGTREQYGHDPNGKFGNVPFSITLSGLLRHSAPIASFGDRSILVQTMD